MSEEIKKFIDELIEKYRYIKIIEANAVLREHNYYTRYSIENEPEKLREEIKELKERATKLLSNQCENCDDRSTAIYYKMMYETKVEYK